MPDLLKRLEKTAAVIDDWVDKRIDARTWGGPTIYPEHPINEVTGRAHASDIRELLTQVRPWHSIETAPKDGTVIDVWREEGGRETVFWGYPHHTCGEMGRYCDSDWHNIRAPGWVCIHFNQLVGRNHNPFTHWQLPSSPIIT